MKKTKSKKKVSTAKTPASRAPRSKKSTDAKTVLLLLENVDLRQRLSEAEETLTAIREGSVDAVVVSGPQGDQVYALKGAEQPYRILVESMNEGALSLTETGTIINCNKAFAEIAGESCGMLIGRSFRDMVSKKDRERFGAFWQLAVEEEAKTETELTFGNRTIPAYVSINARIHEGERWVFAVVTDISERKRTEAELAEYRLHLERLVNDKTAEVQAMNEELQAANEELIVSNENLRESEERFRAIANNTPDHIVIQDRDLRYQLVINPQLGLTEQDMLGKTDFDFLTREDAEKLTVLKQNVMESRTPSHIEVPLRAPDGSIEYFNGSYVPHIDAQGRVDGLIGYFRNITDRKRMEEALQRSETLYRSIGESIDYGVWICEPDGRNTYASESFLKMVGITQEQCSNFGWGDVLHPDDAERTITAWKECVRKGGKWDIEHRFRGVDGQWHHVLARGVPVKNEQGEIISWAGINLDIDNLKKAEQALLENDKKLSAIYATMSEGLALHEMVYDNSGKSIDYMIVDVNPAYEKITGLKRSAAVGKKASALYGIGEPPYLAVYAEVASTGNSTSFEVHFAPMNKYFHIAVFSPDKGKFATIFQDITTRKKAEQDLLKLSEDMAARNLELESLNKELEAYMYSVSHDLRAPLRSVSGFAKAVLDDYANKLDAQGKDYLVRIFNGSEKMARLINDLLHLSRISRQEVVCGGVDLSAAAAALVKELREANPERNVQVEIMDGLTVLADHALLKIALENLIGNAWKFTSNNTEAKIEIGAMKKDSQTIYYIKDNGAGFDPAYADRMFAPFKRLHSDKEFEGTGIGLAIVERIIHKHGGRVWAEGDVGKGATVFFTVGQTPGKA